MIDILKLKPLKFKPLTVKGVPLMGNLRDTDKDGIPDRFDCSKFNPRKQGLLHYAVGAYKKHKSPEMSQQAQGMMEKAEHYIKQGEAIIDEGYNQGNQELITYGEQLKLQGEAMMQKAYQLQEEAQVQYAEGVQLQQRESEQIKKNIREGLVVELGKGEKKAIRRFVEGPRGIPPRTRILGERRHLTREEKLSSDYQHKSIFPLHSPYRPLSTRQILPKLPLISSPTAERMRTGEPYEFPLKNVSFMPRFVGFTPRREVEYYEEDTIQ